MAKISYVRPQELLDQNVDRVFQNLHNNLRSGKWEPTETAYWGTVNEQVGFYQLVGKICFVVLYVKVTNPILGSVNDRLTLPVEPLRNTAKTLFYRFDAKNQFNMIDKTTATDLGSLYIHPTNYTLSTPVYAPAAGTYDITISGWYWVEG